MGVAHYPLSLGFLAWFGLIPLLIRLKSAPSFKSLLGIAYLWGFAYNLTTIFWLGTNIGTVRIVAMISMLASVLFMALNSLYVVVLWQMMKRWIWGFPVAWTVIEYIRTFGSLGFPWINLANTQTDYLLLAQNAEITGIYGISFWIVLLNILGLQVYENHSRKNILVYAVLFFLPWISGLLLLPDLSHPQSDPVSVAVVQPNIHLSEKWEKDSVQKNIEMLIDLSLPSYEDSVDLVIWPETAVASYILTSGRKYLRQVRKPLKSTSSLLLTGTPHSEKIEKVLHNYNAVVLLDGHKTHQVYKKISLVPMAEYIPLSTIFPALKKLNLGQANFTAGAEYTQFEIKDVSFSSVVCFETTFPALIRNFVKSGAQFIVAVVNDGWYENAPEPQQHASQFIYRAIETRRPVIRCANTGISMVVDAAGNILEKTRLNEPLVIRTHVYPSDGTSFYVKFGDIFAWLNLAFSVLILLTVSLRKK